MNIEEKFKRILDCAFEVHTALGPGMLESAYEECLQYELKNKGLSVEKQKPMPLVYKETRLDIGYRIDLMVDNQIIIEIKSADALAEVHQAQILTYMRFSESKLGLLVNFNVKHLKDGIKRFIL